MRVWRCRGGDAWASGRFRGTAHCVGRGVMLRITNAAIGKSGFVGGPRGGWSFAGERDVYKEIRGCRRDRGGAPSTKRAQAPFVRLPRNPHRSRPLSACCRPPLTHGDITKMLPMDPVAAALTRALSRQFSDAFITTPQRGQDVLQLQQQLSMVESKQICVNLRELSVNLP